ncbi:hypothetical protein CC1G_08694 [Coprinopsis cinerea okayama7|uniref:Uncharacterized protein n=1 Tax=Coprinopsis cinerea (strain Okayama-7 / 130 / ATCC MYA-4618 / FGSC 9003) TaxID=240176 RepID=A8NZH5_COPC7|nr:hypothetical protein CC1G_08694 [Coprinopsis cinerea okayama7\|eukprot:XP_001837681.1 hypothetical protein CC1G_08694 [Coprinopsis cinerea okayama7\
MSYAYRLGTWEQNRTLGLHSDLGARAMIAFVVQSLPGPAIGFYFYEFASTTNDEEMENGPFADALWF